MGVYNADLKVQVDMYKMFLLLELNTEYNRCVLRGETHLLGGIERAINTIHSYEGDKMNGEISSFIHNGK